jgi:alpha-galactosidase
MSQPAVNPETQLKFVTFHHLQGGDSSLLLEEKASSDDRTLTIAYWGKALQNFSQAQSEALFTTITFPVAHSSYDHPITPSLLREESRGFIGYPTLKGERVAANFSGIDWSTHFKVIDLKKSGDQELEITWQDSSAKLELVQKITLDKYGILKISAKIKNIGEGDYHLSEYIHWLPLPEEITRSLDFTGRWSHERSPQEAKINVGLYVRESREGRSGHDYTITSLALAENASNESGAVYSYGLAFSGANRHLLEKKATGEISVGAGEIYAPGEIILKPAEEFSVPQFVGTYSAAGINGITNNYYAHYRNRPSHPTNIRPRPLTLNMWEAVYFRHQEAEIKSIIDAAAEIGVERVVLDDGWFMARRNDLAGLGDWVVDPAVWPNGLHPIVDYAISKGLEFGLWFEGEMVNPNSDLYRNHPDWILNSHGRVPPLWRNQLTLDLTNPDAFAHVFQQVDQVLSTYKISYIKWDHNRNVIDAGSNGRAAVHNQTLAIYRLFDQLKAAHPGLEIESCASGGARIDLGMIEHADRFWTSDNNDALEREQIQKWSSIAIPPELLGTHVGPSQGHQTKRTLDITYRIANALFGHAGIEWDIREANPSEKAALTAYAKFYKAERNFLHSSNYYRIDYPDQSASWTGRVSASKEKGIFFFFQNEMPASTFLPKAKFVGLDPQKNYRVNRVKDWGEPETLQRKPTLWWDKEVVLSGELLCNIGISLPILAPANAFLISCTAI